MAGIIELALCLYIEQLVVLTLREAGVLLLGGAYLWCVRQADVKAWFESA